MRHGVLHLGLVEVVKKAYLIACFIAGFGVSYLWDKGVELRKAESDKVVLRAGLASCLKSNKAWEELVQKWATDESTCDAVIDFNKAMDVLDRETKLEAKKAGVR